MNKSLLILTVLALAGTVSTRGADKVDFAKEIAPVFQKSCLECHGPEKQKGKLRLDTKEAVFKGGEDGPIIVVKDALKSDLIRRVTLAQSNDDAMPPSGKGEPLTKAQIELIAKWIDQGAEWPDGFVIKGTGGAAATASTGITPPKAVKIKPTAAEVKAIAQIAKIGVDVRPIAMDTSLTQANFRTQAASVTDATIAPLKDIATLADLNLAGTKITDAGLAHLKDLKNLSVLHLEETKITDSGLANLKGLENLAYLNLYATGVSDAGLENLKGLKNLRRLYLWQTKVTDAGVKKLQDALPGLQVVRGWDLPALAKMEDKKDDSAAKAAPEKKKKKK